MPGPSGGPGDAVDGAQELLVGVGVVGPEQSDERVDAPAAAEAGDLLAHLAVVEEGGVAQPGGGHAVDVDRLRFPLGLPGGGAERALGVVLGEVEIGPIVETENLEAGPLLGGAEVVAGEKDLTAERAGGEGGAGGLGPPIGDEEAESLLGVGVDGGIRQFGRGWFALTGGEAGAAGEGPQQPQAARAGRAARGERGVIPQDRHRRGWPGRAAPRGRWCLRGGGRLRRRTGSWPPRGVPRNSRRVRTTGC